MLQPSQEAIREGPEDILGKESLLAKLTKAVVERALGAELTHHLGYAPGGVPAQDGGNCRNGTSAKTLIGEGGQMEIAVSRDRHSTFEPRLMAKGQRRFAGFDEKIIAMYAGGMVFNPNSEAVTADLADDTDGKEFCRYKLGNKADWELHLRRKFLFIRVIREIRGFNFRVRVQPQRGCSTGAREAATPTGLKIIQLKPTQGSSRTRNPGRSDGIPLGFKPADERCG